MRIGIDARFYGSETGIGRYLERLIAELEKLDTEHEYAIFLRPENERLYQSQNPRFKKIIAPIHWYTLREQTRFPRILNRAACDLVHFPHWNIPLAYRRPFVVTIHDLILLQYPSRRATTLAPLLFAAKFIAYKAVLGSAARRAAGILTVSEFSRKEICRTFAIPPARVTVTNLAPGLDTSTSQHIEISKYRDTSDAKPYILFVGNSYPHKNLERLIRAFALVNERVQTRHELVLAGPEDFFKKRLQQDVSATASGSSVKFVASPSDRELENLYRNAALFVMPSLTEGFGIPPLEAMAAGVPVVSARAGSLPEVLGEAALYFNPLDIEEMAATMLRGLTSRDVREDLIARGHAQAEKYSWRACAEETLAVYKQILKNDSTKNKK